MRAAVVGGGVCGLVCAIRLAEAGVAVTLFEAAPGFGGRAGSFHDARLNGWFDHGPHLLIGACHRLRALLDECDAGAHLRWQPALRLPLWDAARGAFTLAPSPLLPLAAALPLALARLPGHGAASAIVAARLGLALRRKTPTAQCVSGWMRNWRANDALARDMIAPLCLGAMNETPDSASAASFARVLRESFGSHARARLGWFDAPLKDALIAPLVRHAKRLGARLVRRRIVRREEVMTRTIGSERFDAIALALPAPQRDRLLGLERAPAATAAIHNHHFWFEQPLALGDGDAPFVGGIGTRGQWFFDIGRQMRAPAAHGLAHICVVISDARSVTPDTALLGELAAIAGLERAPRPVHARLIRQKRATVLVRPHAAPSLPAWLVDAGEAPSPGDLPATIESAVRRGERAAGILLARMEGGTA